LIMPEMMLRTAVRPTDTALRRRRRRPLLSRRGRPNYSTGSSRCGREGGGGGIWRHIGTNPATPSVVNCVDFLRRPPPPKPDRNMTSKPPFRRGVVDDLLQAMCNTRGPPQAHRYMRGGTKTVKLEYHDDDTDTDTDILARILADTSDTRD